jgi:hypothetical protein
MGEGRRKNIRIFVNATTIQRKGPFIFGLLTTIVPFFYFSNDGGGDADDDNDDQYVYSVVTDLALQTNNPMSIKPQKRKRKKERKKEKNAQVPREINITPVPNRQMITQQLQRYNIQQPLQTVHRPRHPDRRRSLRDVLVSLVAKHDRLRLARRDLCERRLHLRVERVLGHDDDDRHVFIHQRQGSVLELAGEDAFRVHVGDFFDFEGAFEAGGVPRQRRGKNSISSLSY